MKRRAAAVALTLALLAAPRRAAGGDEADGLFATGLAALKEGRASDAIAQFEALADRGIVDENVSYNRGLAYAARVRMGREAPGDLGQAAQAFEEAGELARDGPVAADAATALATVRSEIARRRARAGESAEIEQARPLARALVLLASEDVWATGALVASVLLTAGLYVRGLGSIRRVRIGATIAIALAAPALLAFVVLTVAARDERLHGREGVVVRPTAPLSDERGTPLPRGSALPEGARVRMVTTRPGWVRVRWGAQDGWVAAPSVRPLAARG